MTLERSHQVHAEQDTATDRTRPGDVLVAVGDEDSTPALRYAVPEARRRTAGVRLVHVLRLRSADLGLAEEIEQATVRGLALLRTAADVVHDLDPDVAVSVHLARHGAVADAVVEQGAEASVIVVQHRHLGRLHRVFTHSVARAVAAHADAPVVAVPDSWAPDSWAPDPVAAGSVVVFAQDVDEARPLVARAVEEAERRDRPLRVVHAGAPGRDATGIADVVEEARAARPHLSIEALTAQVDPEVLLREEMADAELLVLGRRHVLRPGSHLGPVARAALDHADRPVMLVQVRTA